MSDHNNNNNNNNNNDDDDDADISIETNTISNNNSTNNDDDDEKSIGNTNEFANATIVTPTTNNNSNNDNVDNDIQIETNDIENTDETDITTTNTTTTVHNDTTVPESDLIERGEDMIDMIEQEIEECYQTLGNIHDTIDNLEDDNTTYERRQNNLKILQASEWARIKKLRWDICKIHEGDKNVTESEIRSNLSQYPELCTSLDTLLVFLGSNSLRITHHHPEFWLQVVNIDNELATDNIIIMTKYIHDILLTAITPYNEQDLFQWYDYNKEQLQSQFSGAHDTDTSRSERKCHEKEYHHRKEAAIEIARETKERLEKGIERERIREQAQQEQIRMEETRRAIDREQEREKVHICREMDRLNCKHILPQKQHHEA